MKIVIVQRQHNLFSNRIIGAAGVGVILNILFAGHEASSQDNQLYFIQEDIRETEKKKNAEEKYTKTKFIFVKYNRFLNTLQRGINKLFRIIGWKLLRINRFKNTITTNYSRAVFKKVCGISPDIIIFEDHLDPIIKKYYNKFGAFSSKDLLI